MQRKLQQLVRLHGGGVGCQEAEGKGAPPWEGWEGPGKYRSKYISSKHIANKGEVTPNIFQVMTPEFNFLLYWGIWRISVSSCYWDGLEGAFQSWVPVGRCLDGQPGVRSGRRSSRGGQERASARRGMGERRAGRRTALGHRHASNNTMGLQERQASH